MTTASGDFFKAVPAGGDADIMTHIIHDWYDDKATAILKNIRAVLPNNGRVILLGSGHSRRQRAGGRKDPRHRDARQPGGKERTEEEFRALFSGACFELTRVVPTHSPLTVVEAKPRA